MYASEDAIINEVLNDIKIECPKAYQWILSKIDDSTMNHVYYSSVRQAIKCAFDTGFLPESFDSRVARLNKAIDSVFKNEIVGVWKGGADGTNESITLTINADKTIKLVREWDDIDSEEVCQVFDSSLEKYIECKGMIVCDLWSGEQKATSIKISLFPNITHTKTMDGSMYWFSEGIKGFCMRVQFEYSSSKT